MLNWLLNFVHIQLFLTLISMPLLISWGLPLSLASLVGNLLFLPFLSLFLFFSALIFFLELMCLPNMWFIYSLEKITSLWLWLINFGSPSWLISFAQPSLWLLMMMPACAIALLYYQRFSTKIIKNAGLLLVLLLSLTLLTLNKAKNSNTVLEIPCNNGLITVINHNNIVTLIDPGILGKKISTPTWIEFTLLPMLNKKFGSNRINNLIIMQPSIITFECIEKLADLCQIKYCFIPLWEGNGDKPFLRAYWFMKRSLEKNKTNLKRILKKSISPSQEITISPLIDAIKYREISFPVICVRIELKNKTLEIYSEKKQK